MNRLFPLLCLSLVIASPAAAQEYLCKNGAAERLISVQHEVDGQELPCVVRYEKKDEGATEFPWNARNQSGYCAEKAEYLATRLGRFGWTCERTDAP